MERKGNMGVGCGVLGGLGVGVMLLVVVGVWGLLVYNGLVEEGEGVRSAWSDIDAQLQRRIDLVPNLVQTVKGYVKHEEGIFGQVVETRARVMAAGTPAEKGEAGIALDQALGRLLALSEGYPELKADTTFVRLQDELAGTENRVAVARTRYNEAVRRFNAAIRKFPGVILAGRMGLVAADYFQASVGGEVVGVKF